MSRHKGQKSLEHRRKWQKVLQSVLLSERCKAVGPLRLNYLCLMRIFKKTTLTKTRSKNLKDSYDLGLRLYLDDVPNRIKNSATSQKERKV